MHSQQQSTRLAAVDGVRRVVLLGSVGLGHGGSEAGERFLREARLEHPEQLALLEANMVVQPLPQFVHTVQVNITGRESVRPSRDVGVLCANAGDELRPSRRRRWCDSEDQALLDFEVTLPRVVPEREETTGGIAHGARGSTPQPQRNLKRLVVVARQRGESL